MKYEIYSVEMRDKIVYTCHTFCKAFEIDKKLEELNDKYPNRKWIFGIDIHFRVFDNNGEYKVGWDN